MQEIITCELIVDSQINGQNESVAINGKGYYKKDDVITVYFSSGNVKYKFVYDGEVLTVVCNDSVYKYRFNKEEKGEIKNGDYLFVITTFATKIEVLDRTIVLEYNLSQDGQIIGKYKSKLSF